MKQILKKRLNLISNRRIKEDKGVAVLKKYEIL